MTRSIWKGPFSLKQKPLSVLHSNLKSATSNKYKSLATVWVWSRGSMVLPKHLGKDVKIYNGKIWISRKIVEQMVGHKFGEFCSTRKNTIHKKHNKKQMSRKK